MFIAANWKAYVESADEAKKLFAASKRLATSSKHTIVLAPPTPFLGMLAQGNRSKVAFAAQDISTADKGAHTGETTVATAHSAGATYVIVGHSERRAGGEDNALVAQKLARVLSQGLIPILCVGERERDASSHYLTFLREEISSALTPLSQKKREQVIIAYEPIWAIGKTASESITTDDLTEMVLYLRKLLTDLLTEKKAKSTIILYGGSVEPDNAQSLAQVHGINGFLIGHASADPHTFSQLVKAVSTSTRT